MKFIYCLTNIAVIFLLSISAEAALINLNDIGAIATANDYWGDRTPDKAIDDDESTLWVMGGFGGHWLAVDLGGGYDLNQVDLFAGVTGSRYMHYQLSYSLDNTTWNLAGEGTFRSNTNTVSISFTNPTTVQYLRYDITTGNEWAHLNEMKVYGTESDPIPEPGTMLLFGVGLTGFISSRLKKKT